MLTRLTEQERRVSDLLRAIKAGQPISDADMREALVGYPGIMEGVVEYMRWHGYSDFDSHAGIATPGKVAD
jgi:hypothetical protein